MDDFENKLPGTDESPEEVNDNVNQVPGSTEIESDAVLDSTDTAAEEDTEELSESEDNDADGIPVTPEEETVVIDPEDLCLLCGENIRDYSISPDYDLCATCREKLIRCPTRFTGFLMLCIVICICSLGFNLVKGQLDTVSAIIDADTAYRQNNMSTAIELYSSAGTSIGEKAARRYVNACWESGNLNSIPDIVSANYTERSLASSRNSDVKKLSDKYAKDMDTFDAVYAQLKDYDEQIYYGQINAEDVPYDALLGQIKSMYESDQNYSETFLVYGEYYLSTLCERSNDEYYTLLKRMEELSPDYHWLFARPLAECCVQLEKYDEAKKYANMLKAHNNEDDYADYYLIRIAYEQEKYADVISMRDTLDEEIGSYPSAEEYKLVAIAYMLTGDNESAKELLKTAYNSYYMNVSIINSYALVCKLTDDDEGYNDTKTLVEDEGYVVNEYVDSCAAGEITVKKFFDDSYDLKLERQADKTTESSEEAAQ